MISYLKQRSDRVNKIIEVLKPNHKKDSPESSVQSGPRSETVFSVFSAPAAHTGFRVEKTSPPRAHALSRLCSLTEKDGDIIWTVLPNRLLLHSLNRKGGGPETTA